MASILALMLLAIMAVLALAYNSVHQSNLFQSENRSKHDQARLQAESGLAFVVHNLKTVRLPPSMDESNFLTLLHSALSSRLNGTPNLAGQTVSLSQEGYVYIPTIQVERGSFSCWIGNLSGGRCRLAVQGQSRGVNRTIAVDFVLTPKLAQAFDYGLASRGKITFGGSAKVLGVNYMAEANVVSATTSSAEAILISGSNVRVSGDLFAAGDDSYISIIGAPWIAGSNDPAQVAEHIHFGVEPPDFPEVTTDHLRPLAVNIVDGSTNTAGGTFNNILIKAGTNPTFSSDTVINGIVYVEQPNNVKFNGQTVLNGFVVTQPGGDPSACSIEFAGTCDARGVDALPSTPEFAAVKQQTGTFLLAPGFHAKFTGNFSTINGSVAADQLTFSGTAEGIIKGTVIGLQDRPTSVGGNVDIFVDRKNANPNPTGFRKSFAFVADSNSYIE